MEHMGWISLIPTSVVVILAIMSKRALEPLIGGAVIGFFMLTGSSGLNTTIDTALKVLGDDVIRWIILTVGLFGALTSLLIRSGAAAGFSIALAKFVKDRKTALLGTWMMGLIIFIDDYLNALTIGSSMKGLTDKHRVSRQMLAYVVDATAAPVCVLIPLSTWAIYVSGLLESNNVAEVGQGLSVYIDSIPYMVYPIVTLILVPVVAMGWIPALGAMKKAEERAARGESTATLLGETTAPDTPESEPKLINFILPVASLLFFTWYFDIDVLKGVVCALIVTYVLYASQRLISLNAMFDSSMEGLKGMVPAIAIIVASFMLKDVNEGLGLANFIIESVTPYMSATMLPVITFATLSLIAFSTGSFWGMYAVSFPIILPLGQSLGVDTPLLIGSIISAGAFGSHACFYGDSTVLSATATGCEPMDHALTQLPYILIAAGISLAALFLIAS